MPAAPGVYLLLCDLAAPADVRVRSGRRFALRAGCYVYTGSARGPGGLAARLGRHLRGAARAHWHIDFLLQSAVAGGCICLSDAIADGSSPVTLPRDISGDECMLADLAGGLPGAEVVPGFGASDCACRGHLIRLGEHGSAHKLSEWLEAAAVASGREWPAFTIAERGEVDHPNP